MIHYFTSESVTSGHPDKVCDQIADRILDAILSQDPAAHVALCCFAFHRAVTLGNWACLKALPCPVLANQPYSSFVQDYDRKDFH